MNTEPPLITPTWARLLTLPAIIAFISAGVGIVGVGFSAASREKEATVVLISVNLIIGGFFFYVAWRAFELFQYKMTRAEIRDGRLWIKRTQHTPPESYDLDELQVTEHRAMQIVDALHRQTGRKLFATHHWYPRGMDIAVAILTKRSEPASEGT